MKKTKLLTTLGAVALIGAIGVGSTFAYLSATTNTVKNTFTVGNVSFDGLNGGLTESKVERDATTGKYKDVDNEIVDGKVVEKWTVKENKYENLVANEDLYKDPTVHIAANSEDCWVYAKIVNTNPDLAITYSGDWKDVTEAYKAAKNIMVDIDYVVYAKKDKVVKSTEVTNSTIFTNVHVGDTVTGKTTFNPITVKACAVQAAGFASYTDALSVVTFE